MSVHFSTKITEYFYPAEKGSVPKKRVREQEDGATVDDGLVKARRTLPVGNQQKDNVVDTNSGPTTPPPAPRKPKANYALPTDVRKIGILKV